MSSVILNILALLSAIAVEYFIFLDSDCSEKRHLALSCCRYQSVCSSSIVNVFYGVGGMF